MGSHRVLVANEGIGKETELSYRQKPRNIAALGGGMLLGLVTSLSPGLAQVATSSEFLAASAQSNGTSTQTLSPLPTLTFRDALERAQRNDPQFQSAVSDAR